MKRGLIYNFLANVKRGNRGFSQTVRIPVISIGAESSTDGQVLVRHGMLGMSLTGRTPKFVRNFC